MSWSGVLTNRGNEMIAAIAGGGHVMEITRAAAGKGTTENPRQATALADPVAAAVIAAKRTIDNGVRLKVQVGPADTAYTAKEIGLFAKLDNGTEALIALAQNSDGVGIPDRASSPDFVFGLDMIIVICNADALQVTVDPTAYVSAGTFEEAVEEIQDDIVELRNQHEDMESGGTMNVNMATKNNPWQFEVPYIRVYDKGHISYLRRDYYTMPAADSEHMGLMSKNDKVKLDGIATGANNYVHPSYPANNAGPTANLTPGFGEVFPVPQASNDSTGHVTLTRRTVKMPDSVASSAANGLMSKNDKVLLEKIDNLTQVSLTNNSTYIDRGSIMLYKVGKVVQLILAGLRFKNEIAIGSPFPQLNFNPIPTKYLPKYVADSGSSLTFPVWLIGQGTAGAAPVDIDGTGAIKVTGAPDMSSRVIPQNALLYGVITYICNDYENLT
jgi:hypothetical protein